MGLGSIKEYVIYMGIIWDVKNYKKKQPEYEAKQINRTFNNDKKLYSEG
jgi:hypothetical protein